MHEYQRDISTQEKIAMVQQKNIQYYMMKYIIGEDHESPKHPAGF